MNRITLWYLLAKQNLFYINARIKTRRKNDSFEQKIFFLILGLKF